MVTIDKARQLFTSYRFDEAVEAYKNQLREAPNEWANIEGLSHALMAVGRYAEAIPYLERVNEYAMNLHPGATGRQIELSVCHWIIGERPQALGIIKSLVVAVRDGKIGYTDIAGGVTQGLILCYMAATLQASSDVDIAMRFLKKLATRQRIKYWPGPAALFLLGGLTFGETMKGAMGVVDLARAKTIAEQDLMKRRHLTVLLFTAGTERRMAGDEAGCRMFMIECANLTHPQVEYEWYLAKYEAAQAERWR